MILLFSTIQVALIYIFQIWIYKGEVVLRIPYAFVRQVRTLDMHTILTQCLYIYRSLLSGTSELLRINFFNAFILVLINTCE